MLLVVGFVILLLYNSLAQHTETLTVDQPTQQIYQQLLNSVGSSSVRCPCSQISTAYETFIDVDVAYHEVCSSSFVQDAWIESIFVNGSWSNMSKNEFIGRGVVYFEGLRTMCSLAHTNNTLSVSAFLSSSLLSADLLPEKQLSIQISSTISEYRETNKMFQANDYGCIQHLVNANQLMTVYATNWIFSIRDTDSGKLVITQPVPHGNCSCTTDLSCSEPVRMNGQIIPGFVVGCLSLESLFQSSLVCLYNQTCVDSINMARSSVRALNASLMDASLLGRSIIQLVNNAFDEEWQVNVSYSSYFEQCRPSQCFYSVSKRLEALHIIVTLLGLYGGLTAVLRVFAPQFISIRQKIANRLLRGNNRVQSAFTDHPHGR